MVQDLLGAALSLTQEKYRDEMTVLIRFFTLYCQDHHKQEKDSVPYALIYNSETLESLSLTLCTDCMELLRYIDEKLRVCDQNPKPRCRHCPNPCYGKKEWKRIARIMRYSGMKSGLTKTRQLLSKLLP